MNPTSMPPIGTPAGTSATAASTFPSAAASTQLAPGDSARPRLPVSLSFLGGARVLGQDAQVLMSVGGKADGKRPATDVIVLEPGQSKFSAAISSLKGVTSDDGKFLKVHAPQAEGEPYRLEGPDGSFFDLTGNAALRFAEGNPGIQIDMGFWQPKD